ncbi:YfhO family protein [Lacticaseibacillus kribbianus]|uniref:YfhO family protein n=1 Tax=Lacticaseibacillus kribbianus TaxID=2926292 RepID=UPI001CD4A276|nr:YfhO family protein [Lacticaseibacillus kribbianus]
MRLIRFVNRHALWFAALVPALIMAVYFAATKVYPFGNSSVMTVDMGQQYIDFYSLWRQTVLGHPGQLFYAFSKDLGGDMFGVFAYYLLSPFNVVILLFPKTALDLAITAMTLTKYAACGLAAGWYLRGRDARGGWLIGLATTYALSGWMLANQLNLMWLDAAVFLPLIALGLDRLVARGRVLAYAAWLAVAIIANYYMGYMICLFLIGYFGFAVVAAGQTGRRLWGSLWRFATGSLLAGGLAAGVLLPTLFQLAQSKGTYTVTKIHWRFESDPIKLLGKLFAGSFSFDQMPSGEANIFLAGLVLIAFGLYFFDRRIRWQERLAAGAWTLFLGLSVMFEPLDLLWHGMQFPVWYPYRFSFVIVFWMLQIAWRELAARPNGPSLIQLLGALAGTGALCAFVFFKADDYPYLSTSQIVLTTLMFAAAIVLMAIRDDARPWFPLLACTLLVVNAGANAVVTLNQLSYISHSDYHTYTEALRGGITKLQRRIGTADRIGKTVLRTKNDAMQVGYMGTDQFNSMFEPAVPTFFGAIGQSAGDGFVAYTAGTVITDAFLDLRGFVSPNLDGTSTAFLPQVSARPDLLRYDEAGHTTALSLYENPYALGLGFAASADILTTKLTENAPVLNQERLLNGLLGQTADTYFTPVALAAPHLIGVTQTGAVFTKKPIAKTKTVAYTFTAPTTDPYYLQIGANFTDGLVSLTQDGRAVPIYDTFRDKELLNVTPSEPGKSTTLTFTLNKDSADFGDVQLYRLDQSKVTTALTGLKRGAWHNLRLGDRRLSATATVAKRQVLMTSIPNAPGWSVKVDGKRVTAQTALGLFIAVPLTAGTHRIAMTYTPPYLWVGVAVSALALLVFALVLTLSPVGRHAQPRRWRRRAEPEAGPTPQP